MTAGALRAVYDKTISRCFWPDIIWAVCVLYMKHEKLAQKPFAPMRAACMYGVKTQQQTTLKDGTWR